MIDIPETEPASITAGDTIKWKRHYGDYLPGDGWTLSYALVKDGQHISLTATDNGDGYHLVTIAKAASKAYQCGEYYWQSYVDDGSERYQVDSGTIEIKPNFEALKGGYDSRTHVQKTYEALKAVIEQKATQDQLNYTMPSGRSIGRMTWPDILKAYDKYKALYAQEQRAERIANGLGHNGKIFVRL